MVVRSHETQLVGWTSAIRPVLSPLMVAFVAVLPGLHSTNTRTQTLPETVLACVPCHQAVGNDQVGEWLSSPYSAQPGGMECHGCHQLPCSGARAVEGTSPGMAGPTVERLRGAARLTVTAVQSEQAVSAEVVVANVGACHLLPTGSADQILILEVSASDQSGNSLPLKRGPVLPAAAAEVEGDAGRIYRAVPDPWDSEADRPRLEPFATDVSRYQFELPDDEPAMVSARLLLIRSGNKPMEMANTSALCRPARENP